jgi:stearoyl-CoA desaturase (Delta-9 desaturase)
MSSSSFDNEYLLYEQESGIPFPFWMTGMFQVIIHMGALAALLHTPHFNTLVLTVIYYFFSGLGICIGYHRYWTHRSFKCGPSLRIVLAILGAITMQRNISWWVFRHRLHHRYTDTENDPHNSKKGLWYSHIGWLLFEKQEFTKAKFINMRDIRSDPVVLWQENYYLQIVVFFSLVLPSMIACLWGDSLGGFLYAGFVARVIVLHCTYVQNRYISTLFYNNV